MKSFLFACLIFANSTFALNIKDREIKISDYNFTTASFTRSLDAISSIRKDRGNVPVYFNKTGCMVYGDWREKEATILSERTHRIEFSRKEALTGKAFLLIKLTPESVEEKSLAMPTNIKYITCMIDPKISNLEELENRLDGIIVFE